MKFTLVLLCLLPVLAFARGEATNHTVDHVRVDKSGFAYVQFTTDLIPNNGSLPACASSYPKTLAFDTNTEGGKAILSIVLSAKMSDSKIFARGTNECEGYGVIENWSYGYIK